MISDGKEVKKDWSQLNTYEVTEKGSKIALIGLGTFYFLALQTAEMLEKKGIHATVINPYTQQSLPDSRQYTDPVKSGHTSSG